MRRRIWLAVLLVMVCTSCAFATEEEEEISFFDSKDTISVTPAPTATPAPVFASATPAAAALDAVPQTGNMSIIITATGDLTIGTNYKAHRNLEASSFGKELKRQGGNIDFYLRNIKKILAEDDLTIVNFEGTLADKVVVPSSKRGNGFLFLAPTSYAQTLPDNSIEAATLENNHVMDFGEDGYASTMAALQAAGVVVSNSSTLGIYEVKGVKIGMLAYQTFNGGYDYIYSTLQNDIENARSLGCDIVTVSYHWGQEKDYHPNDNQQRLGKATIDAGADLVIGHHSHRINPIEEYNGKYIVYSLGNFSFAGNNKPSDMLTFVFQIKFKYRRGEMYGTDFRIIPCRISSKTDYNDFAVTPVSEARYIDTILNTLKKEGKYLSNPVSTYPLEWER